MTWIVLVTDPSTFWFTISLRHACARNVASTPSFPPSASWHCFSPNFSIVALSWNLKAYTCNKSHPCLIPLHDCRTSFHFRHSYQSHPNNCLAYYTLCVLNLNFPSIYLSQTMRALPRHKISCGFCAFFCRALLIVPYPVCIHFSFTFLSPWLMEWKCIVLQEMGRGHQNACKWESWSAVGRFEPAALTPGIHELNLLIITCRYFDHMNSFFVDDKPSRPKVCVWWPTAFKPKLNGWL